MKKFKMMIDYMEDFLFMFFPGVFSKWLAYSINVLAMAGILIMLYKIGGGFWQEL